MTRGADEPFADRGDEAAPGVEPPARRAVQIRYLAVHELPALVQEQAQDRRDVPLLLKAVGRIIGQGATSLEQATHPSAIVPTEPEHRLKRS